ncbi:M48 family metallopeptidase [Streptomyces sp. NPDC002734]|uniref:M48 family metallopeptidase n=1 Tax=Streptomyces sp. NPDC002734 TaxID=3154426 RepID=UPI003332F4D8
MSAPAAERIDQPCPECGERIEADARYTVWCAACEWNVDPVRAAEREERPRLLERRRRELARRHGERLLREVADGKPLRAHRDVPALLAQAISVLVHAVTVTLVVAGLWCLVAGRGTGLVVLGAAALLVAVALRPRFGAPPDDVPLLVREDAPELFALVDEVARTVGTRGVDLIAVDEEFNASVWAYGVRGRRLLTIGLPLWEVLTPRERIALLGHELGHFANGDTRHGRLVWTAEQSLDTWSYFTAPTPNAVSWQAMAINASTFLPWLLLQGVLLLLDQLTLRAAQRGEYLADRACARAGGTKAAIGLMDRLLLGESVMTTLGRERNRGLMRTSRAADTARRAEGLWERLAEEIASVPDHEIERLRRARTRQGHTVDSTHPPTHLRRRCLALGPAESPRIDVDAARAERIAAELAEPRRTVAREVLKPVG